MPTWLLALSTAIVFAAAWFASTYLTMPGLELAPRALVSAFVGVLYGAGMGIWSGRVRRGHGSAAGRPGWRRSIRSGTVPVDVDVDEWRRALRHHQRQYRPLRWAAPTLYLPMTALSVALAVTGEPLFWLGTALFLTLFVVTAVTTPRVLRRTASMRAELDRRDAAARQVAGADQTGR